MTDMNVIKFRSGNVEDVPKVMSLIDERVQWMNHNDINQWNKNQYQERYPLSYYMHMAETDKLYVLERKTDNMIIAGAVLLTEDDRWGKMNSSAFYVHNLVASVAVKNAGREMLRKIEDFARKQGVNYIRLDCITDNERLNQWYEKLGYECKGTVSETEHQGNVREKRLSKRI